MKVKRAKKTKKAEKVMMILCGFFALSLAFGHASAVEPLPGTDEPEQVEKESGSISIILADTAEGLPKDDVVMGVAKVADIEDGIYILDEQYQSLGIDLNEIETAQQLMDASILLKNAVKDYPFTEVTDEDGCCVFDHLEVGVYLVRPIDTAAYEDIAPCIIAIPTFDEVEKEMVYDVQVLPKHAPHPTIQIRKVDANNHDKVLKDAEFTLYDSNKNPLLTTKTNADGIASFKNIKDGIYYLKETKAPTGYRLSKDEIKVVVDDEFDSGHIYEVTVSNTLVPFDHYKTGDNAPIAMYALVVFISLSLIAGFTWKKKNDGNKKTQI